MAAERDCNNSKALPAPFGVLLAVACCVVWGCRPATTATGEDAIPKVWNFDVVSSAASVDGAPDRHSFSKLAPWPLADADTFYTGCYDPVPLIDDPTAEDRCFGVIDISDPDKPVWRTTVYTFDTVASPSPPQDHVIWEEDYPFPNLPAHVPCVVDWADPDIAGARKAPPCWDPGWNTHSHYVARGPGGLLAVNQERYRRGTERQLNYHGVRFYDVSDPQDPVFLSYWEAPASSADPVTGAYRDMEGTHHFNFDDRYLYLGTEYKGYIGKILVILDLADPGKPLEVGRWWVPGQKTPEEDGSRNWIQHHWTDPVVQDADGRYQKHVGMHYVSLHDDKAYLAYHQAGLIILDVQDKSKPRLLSRVDYLMPDAEPESPDRAACRASAGGQPAACGNAHSAKVVPGREDLLVMSDEYFACPFGHMRIFDVGDATRPRLLSHMALPETVACDAEHPRWARDAERFPRRGPSTHIGNAWNSDIYMMAWYGAGLRAIDISDPQNPQEVGRFIYNVEDDFPGAAHDAKPDVSYLVGPVNQPGSRFAGRDTYDAIFGPGGQIYVSDGTGGLRVLSYTGSGALQESPR